MQALTDRVTELYLQVSNALSVAEVEDESGQGLVEYALIIAVVGVMLAGSLVLLRGGIGNTFNGIQSNLANHG